MVSQLMSVPMHVSQLRFKTISAIKRIFMLLCHKKLARHQFSSFHKKNYKNHKTHKMFLKAMKKNIFSIEQYETLLHTPQTQRRDLS